MISTVTYTGDGATRVFPVAFEIQGENYVVVFIDDVAVNDRTTYDIINNSIVFVEESAPVVSSVIEIVVASSPTEIADLNAPPSTIQTIIDNLAGITSVANTVVPNIDEILLADDNATIATTQAGISTAQAVIATTKASEASISAGNALTSENNADTSEANALSYKNSAEASATTATTQAGIATTKAGEASTSATTALGYRNEVEVFRDEAEASALSVDSANIVHKTGDETIAGIKTFTSSPIVPTPITNMQVATKLYVDGKAIAIASTAEAQAGTNNTNAITPLRLREGLNASGIAPIYACRAWVNFNGTGTVAIRASGNVSSITDNGVGDYTVNFTTAMPDVNYAPLCSGSSSGVGVMAQEIQTTPLKTVTQNRILSSHSSNGISVDITNYSYICVI